MGNAYIVLSLLVYIECVFLVEGSDVNCVRDSQIDELAGGEGGIGRGDVVRKGWVLDDIIQ